MSRRYNIIDADGHVLEPVDLWVKYIDRKFADKAPRVVAGENGKQFLAVDGRLIGHPVFGISRSGSLGLPFDNDMDYQDGLRGGFDPAARIAALDQDGIDAVFLYPSLGLYTGAIQDPDLAAAACRAWNRWLADFCSVHPDRLFPVAMLPMQSVSHAVAELRFCRRELGMRGAFIRPNPYNNLLLGDPAYNPLWAEAQELDVAIGVHEGTGGMKAVGADRVTGWAAQHIVSHAMEMQLACLNIVWGGVCERFPGVRFAFLEAGGGWVPAWLDRMDLHYERKGLRGNPELKIRPSDYFRRQCWISFDPGEETIAPTAEYLGADKLLWATDYPHADGIFPGAPKMIADKLPEANRAAVLAGGAKAFYKLG